MKKLVIILLTLLGLNINSIDAQKLSSWRWEQWNISFKAPSNILVNINTPEEFSAENDFMSISAEQLDYSEITGKNISEYLMDIAIQKELIPEETETVNFDHNGFTGSYIEGLDPNENIIRYIILLNVDSSLALSITFKYEDGYQRLCNTILNSFTD